MIENISEDHLSGELCTYTVHVALVFFFFLLFFFSKSCTNRDTVQLQWLQHLCNHENMFETGEVRANEC